MNQVGSLAHFDSCGPCEAAESLWRHKYSTCLNFPHYPLALIHMNTNDILKSKKGNSEAGDVL